MASLVSPGPPKGVAALQKASARDRQVETGPAPGLDHHSVLFAGPCTVTGLRGEYHDRCEDFTGGFLEAIEEITE